MPADRRDEPCRAIAPGERALQGRLRDHGHGVPTGTPVLFLDARRAPIKLSATVQPGYHMTRWTYHV
jgi:hypothetical protein